MSDVQFTITDALKTLYGIPSVGTFPGVKEQAAATNPNINYSGIRVLEKEERSLSYIGTPVFLPITLKGGDYKRYDKDGKVETTTLGDFRLPLTCVVEMERGKMMTKTTVTSARAAVKEIYAQEDWTIRISGFLHDEPRHPQGLDTFEAMTERLLDFDNLADSIEIDGELFHQRGIYRIGIERITFNQIPRRPRIHGFQIQCESDEALELIIL